MVVHFQRTTPERGILDLMVEHFRGIVDTTHNLSNSYSSSVVVKTSSILTNLNHQKNTAISENVRHREIRADLEAPLLIVSHAANLA